MCLLLESICVKDGKVRNLAFHQERMDRSRQILFHANDKCLLSDHLKAISIPSHGTFKIRVLYNEEITHIECHPYTIRLQESFQLIEDAALSYAMKYVDRSAFDEWQQRYPGKEIIITQNGFITDATYANLAFYDGKDWLTPQTFLLEGTMRQSLIEKGMLKPCSIRREDLQYYKGFKLINAMMSLEESPFYAIGQIVV